MAQQNAAHFLLRALGGLLNVCHMIFDCLADTFGQHFQVFGWIEPDVVIHPVAKSPQLIDQVRFLPLQRRSLKNGLEIFRLKPGGIP